MENNDLTIKIAQFLDGKLAREEADAFKTEMAANKDLAEEVGLARIQRLMQAQMLDDYMERKLAEWHADSPGVQPPPPAPPGKTGKNPLAWLLLLLPLLAVGVWFLGKTPPPADPPTPAETLTDPAPPASPEGTAQPIVPVPPASTPVAPSEQQRKVPIVDDPPMAQQQTLPEKELLAYVDDNSFMPTDYFPHSARGAADDLAKAEKARKAGQTDQAIALYKQVAGQSSSLAWEATWNLGLLYFREKRFAEALPWLEKAAANKDFLYDNDARYHAALCLMATRQFKKADALVAQLLEADYFEENQQREKALALRKWLAGK